MLLYELPRNTIGKAQKNVLRESFRRARGALAHFTTSWLLTERTTLRLRSVIKMASAPASAEKSGRDG